MRNTANLASALALLCAATAAMAGAGEKQLTCSGVVVDAAGKPVAGATVLAYVFRLSSGGSVQGRVVGKQVTGKDGRFALKMPAIGLGEQAVVVARKQSPAIDWLNWRGKRDTTHTLRLGLAKSLAGTVVDEKGKPIAKAMIRLMMRLDGACRATVDAYKDRHATDAKGRYSIRALPRGYQYAVSAVAKGYGRASVKVDLPKGAKAQVKAGDLALLPANLSISGVVVGPKGKPVAGATVGAYGKNAPGSSEPKTDKDGRFKIGGLCAGEASLRVRAKGWRFTGNADAEAGSKDVKIRLRDRRAPPGEAPDEDVPPDEDL